MNAKYNSGWIHSNGKAKSESKEEYQERITQEEKELAAERADCEAKLAAEGKDFEYVAFNEEEW